MARLKEAFDIVGDKITLIGNIQYDCFRCYSPAEMREAVQEVLQEVNGNRFILSPSAGPYEHTLTDQMKNNYLEFMNAGWEYGKG